VPGVKRLEASRLIVHHTDHLSVAFTQVRERSHAANGELWQSIFCFLFFFFWNSCREMYQMSTIPAGNAIVIFREQEEEEVD
jgi:hypothetical protein